MSLPESPQRPTPVSWAKERLKWGESQHMSNINKEQKKLI